MLRVPSRPVTQRWSVGSGNGPRHRHRLGALAADRSGSLSGEATASHSHEQLPGTGIGLAVCRRGIQRHGGRPGVASEAGKGSTFYFILLVRNK